VQHILNNIFSKSPHLFLQTAQEIAQFQLLHNKIYEKWAYLCNVKNSVISSVTDLPFLPIQFFKSTQVVCGNFIAEQVFESSGTTKQNVSKHFVKEISLYKQSFNQTFEQFYGSVNNWCIIALLPSYLERNTSSLVYMANTLIRESKHPNSGFYLNEMDKLFATLALLEAQKQPTLLIGVTFALLDFAEQYQINLQYTTIIETGGMKGRREELTRSQVHKKLQQSFGNKAIHAEYGMTELLSQAYSKGNGLFYCPPYMQVLVRCEDDPLNIKTKGKGVLNIIDFANLYSCSFIATDDIGIVHEDGSFEVEGRLDNSDRRGCSLLTA
jgi:Acyl-protein synthetase, LuxE